MNRRFYEPCFKTPKGHESCDESNLVFSHSNQTDVVNTSHYDNQPEYTLQLKSLCYPPLRFADKNVTFPLLRVRHRMTQLTKTTKCHEKTKESHNYATNQFADNKPRPIVIIRRDLNDSKSSIFINIYIELTILYRNIETQD